MQKRNKASVHSVVKITNSVSSQLEQYRDMANPQLVNVYLPLAVHYVGLAADVRHTCKISSRERIAHPEPNVVVICVPVA